MNLSKIIKKYCEENKELNHTELANKIKKEKKVNQSVRTLRRKIAEERSFNKINYEDHYSNGVLSYKGEKSITSLQEAIDFFDINTKKYNVAKYTVNSWDVAGKNGKRTNYQVKVFLEPKEVQIDFENVKKKLDKEISKFKIKKTPGIGTAVITIADLHIGAKTKGLKLTDDYSYKIVIERLGEIASKVNSLNKKEVHLIMLGDFIESFTGMNHPNSWKGLEYEAYGAEVIINAYKIINAFIKSINNLSSINMVAGNHDRVTNSSKEDSFGDAAKLLHFMLEKDSSIPVDFDPIMLSKKIDGINYLMTHNHLGLGKRDIGKICFDYGDQSRYNVLLGGHWHSRVTKKYYSKESIVADEANYRAISVPSIFSGNFYSESNGWSSTSGYNIIENNGKGKINLYDLTL